MYSRPIASAEKVSATGSTAASENASVNPIDDSPAAVLSLSMDRVDPLKKIGNYGNILEKIRGNKAMAASESVSETVAQKAAEGAGVSTEQKASEPAVLPSAQKATNPEVLPSEPKSTESEPVELSSEQKTSEPAAPVAEKKAETPADSETNEGYSIIDELEKQNERRAEYAEELDEQNAEREEKAKEYYDKLDEQNEKRAEANKEAVNRLRENMKELVKKQVLVKDDGVYLETTITKNGSSTSRRVRIG